MSNTSLSPSFNTLADLLEYWKRGELTLEEVLQRWPHPNAARDEAVHELLRLILGLQAHIAAIDGIR